MKYLLYARKSSESEDRQVQSIDDQVNRLQELAATLNLNIVDIYTEAKSAKQPNNRPEFQSVLSRINAGEADGILCWQINRLSRNPVDSGAIQWMLQNNVIKCIQTHDRAYRPEDNTLLFSVESGMANQFLIELSKNVKRGNRAKAEKGWRPGLAPIGYLNDKIQHTIIEDPDRFDLVRKIFELYLTGKYSVPQIHTKVNDWGLRTPMRHKLGNNKLALSAVYKILSSKFYAGFFDCQGEEYRGKHKAMITLEDFDKIQFLLGKKGKPRPKSYRYPFTGMIKCGECGGMITAETKRKYYQRTNNHQEYIYYRCTKKKKDTKCSQKTIRDFELESQITAELEKYQIMPEFKDWALQVLASMNENEVEERKKIYASQRKEFDSVQHQLDNLTKLRIKELINDEEYIKGKEELLRDKTRLQGQILGSEGRADEWMQLVEDVFDFALHAKDRFETGGLEAKKEILTTLGSNLCLKDGILSINTCDWLILIEKDAKKFKKQYNEWLELKGTKKDAAKASLWDLTQAV